MKTIEIKNLSYFYSKNFKALLDVNFAIEEGDVVFLYGPEGSGKTTLLNLIAGIESLQDGEILIDSKFRKEVKNEFLNISYISSPVVLFENKSVEYNLFYLAKVLNREIKEDYKNQIEFYLKEFNLCDKLKTKVKKLTDDEKEALCYIRCLIKKSEIFLIDEPKNVCNLKNFLTLWRKLKLDASKHSCGVVCVSNGQNLKDFVGYKIYKLCFGQYLGSFTLEKELKNPTDFWSYFVAKNLKAGNNCFCEKDEFEKQTKVKQILNLNNLFVSEVGDDIIEDFFVFDNFKFDIFSGVRV